MTPQLDKCAHKIYWIESMGWDGPGRRRRWPKFDTLPEKERDYWYARAAVVTKRSLFVANAVISHE